MDQKEAIAEKFSGLFVVCGRVVTNVGVAAKGLKVIAVDKSPEKDVVLGEAITDSSGNYSISDVIFHISYTAKDDGSFKETVEENLQGTLMKYAIDHDLIRLFSMKHEFSNELHRFLYPPTEEADQEITMTIDRKNFPYFLHDKTISVLGVELILKLKPGCVLSGQEIALVRGADAATGGEDLEPYSTEDPDFADLYMATCEISGEISDGDQWTLKAFEPLDPDVVEDIGLLFYYTIIKDTI